MGGHRAFEAASLRASRASIVLASSEVSDPLAASVVGWPPDPEASTDPPPVSPAAPPVPVVVSEAPPAPVVVVELELVLELVVLPELCDVNSDPPQATTTTTATLTATESATTTGTPTTRRHPPNQPIVRSYSVSSIPRSPTQATPLRAGSGAVVCRDCACRSYTSLV